MTKAVLKGDVTIPLSLVPNLGALRKALTVTYTPMGEDPIEVIGYVMGRTSIRVPRQFGIEYCDEHHIELDDQTTSGTQVTFNRIPTPRKYQVEVLEQVYDATEEYYDFLFRAHTGWGKTIGALIVAAWIGTTTLVIVDQDNLKDQWLEELSQHFGMTIENGGVGIIQGQVCDYQHPIVIAMVHTLSQKRLPQEVYDYFGLVIVDEVHTAGAPTFSVVLRQFAATFRFGVSATPRRRDGLQKMLDYNLGQVRVAADKQHDESAVYYVKHGTTYSWYANVSPKIGRILTEVAEDGSRNLLIAELAMLLWETGRDTLLLSDRIEQLNDTISLLYYMGVDTEEMGLYAGYTPTYRFAKNPTPARRPAGLVRHEETGEYEYTPVSLQLISKKTTKKQRDHVRANAKLFFATYGMCAKGFNEPRLTAGIDMTPRGAAEQIHGRILRKRIEGLPPIWVTILDENNYRLVHAFANRVQDYEKSNGLMYLWTEDGELIECHAKTLRKSCFDRVKSLKQMRIEPLGNGRHMLATQESVIRQKLRRAQGTAKTTPRSPRVSRRGS